MAARDTLLVGWKKDQMYPVSFLIYDLPKWFSKMGLTR